MLVVVPVPIKIAEPSPNNKGNDNIRIETLVMSFCKYFQAICIEEALKVEDV